MRSGPAPTALSYSVHARPGQASRSPALERIARRRGLPRTTNRPPSKISGTRSATGSAPPGFRVRTSVTSTGIAWLAATASSGVLPADCGSATRPTSSSRVSTSPRRPLGSAREGARGRRSPPGRCADPELSCSQGRPRFDAESPSPRLSRARARGTRPRSASAFASPWSCPRRWGQEVRQPHRRRPRTRPHPRPASRRSTASGCARPAPDRRRPKRSRPGPSLVLLPR